MLLDLTRNYQHHKENNRQWGLVPTDTCPLGTDSSPRDRIPLLFARQGSHNT